MEISKRFLFVSKMESYPDVIEHESSAKRIKLDLGESNIGELCHGEGFSGFSTTIPGPMDVSEGVSVDCDSGYEASTMESLPTPSHHASPHTDPGDRPEESLSNLSESITQTPTHMADQLDTSQDSLEVDDDNASTVSNLSELSGLSDLSGQEWKPMAGSMIWIQKQMQNGVNPRTVLSDLGVELDQIPQYVDEVTLWKLIINMLAEPPRRNKLRHVNSLDDVVRLLRGSKKVIVLTGAGVSVSCGIPDFRSRDGIYSRLAIDFPNLPDPQAMFDISFFSQDPRPFFKFARDIYPGKFQPSPCHKFIKLLEKHKKLLRNYTQNIDTLEKEANIERVIECHGSFATATCTKCGHKVTAEAIRETVLAQKIPLCEVCHAGEESSISTDELGEERDYHALVASGVMKPDIVFFGEGLPDTFHEAMSEDKTQCDLLVVIGSSLKVRPVALIPSSLPPNVPQILINREPLPHCRFDVELLGDCDVIINHLCRLLGNKWEEGIYSQEVLKQSSLLPIYPEVSKPEKRAFSKETEPNCTVDNKLLESECDECSCKCNISTNASSLTVEKDLEINCRCNTNSTSINEELGEAKSPKERHMSIDSARDSGIGDNSNFTDLETKYDDTSDENTDNKDEEDFKMFPSSSSFATAKTDLDNAADLRGLWQPKVKKSLADRLPPHSFHLVPPSRYIFPGAELFYDPDDASSQDADSNSASDSDSDAEGPIPAF
ncbi:unnamed protein product [Brassicogethes aeneus]|uniref:protein acetyllysine N-acetyltransferase n=1 Tax=Brassicogethes aeneus TaxID=1431903 RepID=A0A9P0FBC1_BRAAE|nr:unnamed protein product [Brassicogethes aeneus]